MRMRSSRRRQSARCLSLSLHGSTNVDCSPPSPSSAPNHAAACPAALSTGPPAAAGAVEVVVVPAVAVAVCPDPATLSRRPTTTTTTTVFTFARHALQTSTTTHCHPLGLASSYLPMISLQPARSRVRHPPAYLITSPYSSTAARLNLTLLTCTPITPTPAGRLGGTKPKDTLASTHPHITLTTALALPSPNHPET